MSTIALEATRVFHQLGLQPSDGSGRRFVLPASRTASVPSADPRSRSRGGKGASTSGLDEKNKAKAETPVKHGKKKTDTRPKTS